MSIISYPRTATKGENRRHCHKLISRINHLLSKGTLTKAELQELLALLGAINWAIGAVSYRLKALEAAHRLRVKLLRAQKAILDKQKVNEKDDTIRTGITDNGINYRAIRDFELKLQSATMIISPSTDVRFIVDKLNQPFKDYPQFQPYSFIKAAQVDNTVYYIDGGDEILRTIDLENVDVGKFKKTKSSPNINCIDDKDRSNLEKEIDHIATLSPEIRNAILGGWKKGNISTINDEFPELGDFDKCVEVLNDLGVIFDTYGALDRAEIGKEVLNKYAYQKEHYPPYSLFLVRTLANGEARESSALLNGFSNYSEEIALCFAIFGGQSKGYEHHVVTRASENFMKSLAEDGKKATLGAWLDKGVEFYAEIFAQRCERNATAPITQGTKKDFTARGRKAAVALRNVARAHFVTLGGEDVLEIPLGNGRYRDTIQSYYEDPIKSYKYEVTLLKPIPDNQRFVAIRVNTPSDGALPSSNLFLGYLDKNKKSDCAFHVNSTILDFCVTSSNQYWIGDNEGHVFTTEEIHDTRLNNVPSVKFGFNPSLISPLNQYRLSKLPISAIWCDEQTAIIVDEDGSLWHIESGIFTTHRVCKEPLGFFGQHISDLYLYGRKRQLWHFDGTAWSELKLPDMGLNYWQISGATLIDDNTYLLVTSYGFVFKGNATDGFQQVPAPKKVYSGVASIGERVFVSIPEEGVCEIRDKDDVWELRLIHNARVPLSLQAFGKPPALYTTNALESDKGYFFVVIPGSNFAEKQRVYAWDLGDE